MSLVENAGKAAPRLQQVVADQIQGLILDGVWKKGSRLPAERALCGQFGVSRTVIRESLKRLAAHGVVQEIPRKGTFVSSGVSEPFKDLLHLYVSRQGRNGPVNLYEVRNLLEVEIAGLAAERATSEEISGLQKINAALAKMNRDDAPWSAAKLRRYNDLEFEFHLGLARCTRNELFVVLMSALCTAFTKHWSHIHTQCQTRKQGVDLHTRILDAVRSGDPRMARRATRENLRAFLKASIDVAVE